MCSYNPRTLKSGWGSIEANLGYIVRRDSKKKKKKATVGEEGWASLKGLILLPYAKTARSPLSPIPRPKPS
jgi:hypothetical protein